MAIDFPASPVLNEIFVSGGKSWTYDGAKWVVSPTPLTNVTSISTPNYIAFDTTPTGVPGSPGTLSWNPNDNTFDMALPHSVLQVGMEMYLPPVNNNSGVTIPNGAFVMATGAQGDKITVAKAVTNGTVDPMYMVGVATADILNGDTDGTITVNGIVRDIDTSAWAVGTILYPDPTVAGGLTSTQPDAPAIRTPIAIVLRQQVNTGRILVRMTNGSTLGGTDSNVKFTSLADRNIIEYNSATGIWSNTATPQFTSETLGLGTAALPSLAFTGDLNTGIYSPGADQVAIATAGTSRVVVDSSGGVSIGDTTAPANITTVADRLMVSTDTATGRLVVLRKAAATALAPVVALAKARGTSASPTVVTVNDSMGNIDFMGYDGANYQVGASISASVDSTPGTGDMPGRLMFYTTTDGTTTQTERMRITSAGNVGIGTSAPIRLFHVNSDTATEARIQRNSTDALGPTVELVKQRGTAASPTAVSSGDVIGNLSFFGYEGTARRTAANIAVVADGSFAANTSPGAILFQTTEAGSGGALADRVKVDSVGNVSVLTGTIIAPAATTSLAPLRIPHGTAPSAPTNGDIWTTTAGIYVRINGTTVGPLGAGGGNPELSATISANSAPTTLDSFAVATYTTAEYLIQAKQGTLMTTTHLTVMWDGTDVSVSEWGTMNATAGAANVTFTASVATGTCTVSGSSSDAATTNVLLKSQVQYVSA